MRESDSTFPAFSVTEALEDTVGRLRQAGISNAAWEAREMLAWAMECRPSRLEANPSEPLSDKHRARLTMLVGQRCQRRPLAYVLGEWDFMDFRLQVTPDVLIPRPETEELAELVRSDLKPPKEPLSSAFVIADIGTGSGCLTVALGKFFPQATLLSIDLSAKALAVARRNVSAHGLAQRVMFAQGDLLSHLTGQKRPILDAVVANLPYIDETVIEGLDPEVQHEPEIALNGGRRGLDLIRRLIPQARHALKPGGKFFMEVGYDQASIVAGELLQAGFSASRVEKDFAGIGRFVIGKK